MLVVFPALGLWVKPLWLRDGAWVEASSVFTFVLVSIGSSDLMYDQGRADTPAARSTVSQDEVTADIEIT